MLSEAVVKSGEDLEKDDRDRWSCVWISGGPHSVHIQYTCKHGHAVLE